MHNVITCITPIIVHLPNGHTTQVTKMGSVKLQSNIILHNVLYIPTFTYNLISISQILQHSLKSIIFTHDTCVFQGHDGSQIHGALSGGLYILPSTTSAATNHTTMSALALYPYGMPGWDILQFLYLNMFRSYQSLFLVQ